MRILLKDNQGYSRNSVRQVLDENRGQFIALHWDVTLTRMGNHSEDHGFLDGQLQSEKTDTWVCQKLT